MYFLGIDIGTSSVKVSVVESNQGVLLGSVSYPDQELGILSAQVNWAEQEPKVWWDCTKKAILKLFHTYDIRSREIKAIGIAYQMHGLVLVDNKQQVLRPSIIWCDSRAVEIGNQAFLELGEQKCLTHLLNSPGNFTASKLKWVKDHEPNIYSRIDKVLLPGDYIAMELTGECCTTISGLSEGIFWDFKNHQLADFLLEYFGFEPDFIPKIVPTFSEQGYLKKDIAHELGLRPGIPVTYRAGDQPNNALSVHVFNPGEVAATAGTSGVIYGVSDVVKYDTLSRVNTFAHINHAQEKIRLGILLCINGTGILNSWMKNTLFREKLDYDSMNFLASQAPIGSEGLVVLPFGNGSERVLKNHKVGGQFCNLNFNVHQIFHFFRAAQEGIVFSLKYGLDIMQEIGVQPKILRAGNANMFLSPTFNHTLAGVAHLPIELYDTDGAQGAARGAGIGSGHFLTKAEAFRGLEKLKTIEPNPEDKELYEAAYQNWLEVLIKHTRDLE